MVDESSRSADDSGDGIWAALASARTPEEFCRDWLALQCRVVDGVSDAVVVLGSPEKGRFAPVATWPRGKPVNRQLGECAERALSERRHLVVRRDPPASSVAGDGEPTFQIAVPIQVAQRLHGVVALDVGRRSESQLHEIVNRLSNGSAWLEGLLARSSDAQRHNGDAAGAEQNASGAQSPGAKTRAPTSERSPATDRLQLRAVLDVVATTLGEGKLQAAATALVTELATRLQCDRVALGVVRRRRSALRALSHSATFGKKTNLTRAIERAMDECLDQALGVVYPQSSTASGTDFRITRAHAELSREFGSPSIASFPMSIDGEICAIVTLERAGDLPFDESVVRYCETLGGIVGPLLELRQRDERSLPRTALDTGKRHAGKLFGPGHLGWKLAGILVLATVLFFTFARGDYRVTADTVLEGSVQLAAVAPFNGYIATAPVRAGDVVRTGQVLCTLEDRDLRSEHLRIRSEHEQLSKQYDQALALGNKAQVRIVSAQIDQAKARLDRIEDHLERLQIKAPFDGIVVQGDLSQRLGAPLERGDVLFEIAPLEGYRVIQNVDERDIADVAVGQRGDVVLSTFPTRKFGFLVTKITPVSAAEEGRNYFRVESELASSAAELRPGLEGVSKIEIDRRRLVWIWTHRAVDWVRLKLWSWLP